MKVGGRKIGFRAGFLPFFSIALAVLYAAAGQNNGAAYVLAFFLLALLGVGIVQGLQNVSRLEARLLGSPYGCAPTPDDPDSGLVEIRLGLTNHSTLRAYGLSLLLTGYEKEGEPGALASLPPGEMREASLRLNGLPRGRYRLDAVEVASLFPFGLTEVSRSLILEEGFFWIYPAPSAGGEKPKTDSDHAGTGGGGSGGEDFVGVRGYREGESQRHVDWKAVARGNPMMVKQFGGGSDRAVVLDWALLSGNNEERLSALCHWVLESDRAGDRYGLRLPGGEIAPGSGQEHLQACLRLLAEFPGGGRPVQPGIAQKLFGGRNR